MTNPNYTALALLVDRSGSMARIASDASGAIAAFLDSQRKVPGYCTAMLADFDTEYRIIYPSTDIRGVPPYHLIPGGSTALLDSLGRLITDFGAELAAMPEHARPSTVIVIVQTDGEENSSRQWTKDQIKFLIQQQESVYGWKFVFLGANQDAIAEGARMGFRPDASLTYAASAAGVRSMGATMDSYVTSMRSCGAASFSAEDRAAAMAADPGDVNIPTTFSFSFDPAEDAKDPVEHSVGSTSSD